MSAILVLVRLLIATALLACIAGQYLPASQELSLDGTVLRPDMTESPVYIQMGANQLQYWCPFPCSVARTLGPFCREAFQGAEYVSACMREVWKAHATGEHLLNVREDAPQTHRELGIQRSNNWFERNTLQWPRLFYDHMFPTFFGEYSLDFTDSKIINILEIGSFEGASAMWFARYFLGHEQSRLVCVDLWEYDDIVDTEYGNTNMVLQKFKSNLQLTGRADQVRAIQGDSLSTLSSLISSRDNRFDIVYIDGSHASFDVMGDIILSWSMLLPGGIMILDDVRWGSGNRSAPTDWDDNCQGVRSQQEVYSMHAIQAVLGSVAGGADVLLCDGTKSPQAAFSKRVEVRTKHPQDIPLLVPSTRGQTN